MVKATTYVNLTLSGSVQRRFLLYSTVNGILSIENAAVANVLQEP